MYFSVETNETNQSSKCPLHYFTEKDMWFDTNVVYPLRKRTTKKSDICLICELCGVWLTYMG